jgi:hypothetical protein
LVVESFFVVGLELGKVGGEGSVFLDDEFHDGDIEGGGLVEGGYKLLDFLLVD